ncbi:MAG: hypothetical protein WCX73_02665 [Candidatus Pacearchaeota archaeon]|jgi:hypothetical protein
MENKHNMGWNNKKSYLDIYVGKPVCASHNGQTVHGVLAEVNLNEGYADFKPSIVGEGDNSIAINKELPTRVLLPLGVIRPLTQTLEEYVEKYTTSDSKHKHQTEEK